MRTLSRVVVAESVALVTVVAWWLGSSAVAAPADAAPLPGLGLAGNVVAASGAGTGADADAGAAERRTAAPAAWREGDLGILVHGRLLGRDPPPTDDALRLWYARDGDYRSATANGGRYAVAGLAPGTWRVHGEVDGCRRLDLEHLVTDAAVQEFDLQFEASTLVQVRIRTPSGGPIAPEIGKLGFWTQLDVIATAMPLNGDLPPTEQSSVGNLGLGRYQRPERRGAASTDPNAPDGTLELDQPPPVNAALLMRHLVLAQQTIATGQQEVVFVVDPQQVSGRLATVKARVIDATTGTPIAGASVRLGTAQSGGAGSPSAADGTVTLQRVLPGIGDLNVWAKDREQWLTYVDVPAGGTLDLGDLALQATADIAGRVVDSAGKGIAGSVQWTDLDLWRPPQPLIYRRSAPVDGDGNFKLWGAGAHRYVVIATTDDQRVGYAAVDTRAGAPTVTIAVGPETRVALAVRGDEFTSFTVVARDRAGVPAATRRIEHAFRDQALSLAAGDYTLELYGSDGRLLGKKPVAARGALLRVELP